MARVDTTVAELIEMLQKMPADALVIAYTGYTSEEIRDIALYCRQVGPDSYEVTIDEAY